MPFYDDVAENRNRHWQILILAAAVCLGSLLLNVNRSGSVTLPVSGKTLAVECFSRSQLGVNCPGCGLTRSFVHLAKGNWSQSVAVHPLGWMVAALVVAQIPYRILALSRFSNQALRASKIPMYSFVFVMVALCVVWLYRLVTDLL